MEPERPIEKLLRAFAKKRREQAGDPMELHPVARQQLQKEIARRAAETRGGGWFSSLFVGLRPKLVFAVCFTALVILGLALLSPLTHPKPTTVASAQLPRNEIAPMEKATPAPQSPPPMSTVAPLADGNGTRTFEDKAQTASRTFAKNPVPAEPAGANRPQVVPPAETLKQAEVFKSTIAQTDVSAATPVVAAASSNKAMFAFDDVPAATTFGGEGALSKDATGQPVASAPPPPILLGAMTNGTTLAAGEETQKKLSSERRLASKTTASAAYFDRSKSEGDAVIPPVSQVFNRSDILVAHRRATDTLSDSSPVLLSFRVEQTGNAMRVVDSDGSVYTGALELAQQTGAATRALTPKTTPAAAPAARAGAPSPAVQNYFFRVAGTNRNLKQNVVFSGNFIPITNAARRTGGGGGFGGATIPALRAVEIPVDSPLSNSRISGTAVIGDQKEIEVIATPAP